MLDIDKVYNLDCLEFLGKIPNETIDLIFADPPFNTKKDYGVYKDNLPIGVYYDWCQSWIKECFHKLCLTGSFYIYISSRHLGHLQVMMEKQGIWQNTIIWHFTNPTPDLKRFPKTYGALLFFTKTNKYTFNPNAVQVRVFQNNPKQQLTKPTTRLYDVWYDIAKLTGGFLAQREVILKPQTYKRFFVYQLPEELLRRVILSSTNVKDLVLDPFVHSGTTAAVCRELNRHFIGCDCNPDYIKLAQKRANHKQLALLN